MCPNCGPVDGRDVTYEETHDVRAGGCGAPVGGPDEEADAREFLRSVAAVPLTHLDLSYLVTNVLYARGSLSREVRREAVVAIKTLREILSAARERLPAENSAAERSPEGASAPAERDVQ